MVAALFASVLASPLRPPAQEHLIEARLHGRGLQEAPEPLLEANSDGRGLHAELDRLQQLITDHEREGDAPGWPHCAKLVVAARAAFTRPVRFEIVKGEEVEVQVATDADVDSEQKADAKLYSNMLSDFTDNWADTRRRTLQIAARGSLPEADAEPKMVHVLGPSAAGKSSSTAALTKALLPAAHGFVAVDGADIREASKQYMAVVHVIKDHLKHTCPAGLDADDCKEGEHLFGCRDLFKDAEHEKTDPKDWWKDHSSYFYRANKKVSGKFDGVTEGGEAKKLIESHLIKGKLNVMVPSTEKVDKAAEKVPKAVKKFADKGYKVVLAAVWASETTCGERGKQREEESGKAYGGKDHAKESGAIGVGFQAAAKDTSVFANAAITASDEHGVKHMKTFVVDNDASFADAAAMTPILDRTAVVWYDATGKCHKVELGEQVTDAFRAALPTEILRDTCPRDAFPQGGGEASP